MREIFPPVERRAGWVLASKAPKIGLSVGTGSHGRLSHQSPWGTVTWSQEGGYKTKSWPAKEVISIKGTN